MRSVPRHIAATEVRRVLEGFVAALLNGPKSFRIETTLHKNIYYFDIYVKTQDMGRIIGKRGITASSLRQIMEAISGNYGMTFLVQILENRDAELNQDMVDEVTTQRKLA